MKTCHIAGLIVVLVIAAVLSASGQAGFPTAINYQGRLIQGTNLYNGPAAVVFRIFETDDTEMPPVYEQSNDLTVVDGLYSTYIGDPDGGTDWSFLDRPMEYLRLMVEVNGVVLAPMERLAAVPYALLADGVKYQGITRDMIGPGEVNSTHLDMWAITAYNIFPGTITGTELADQTIPLSKLAQSGAVTGQVIKYSVAGWVAADVESGGGAGVTGLVSYTESGTFIANPVASGTDSIAQGSGARAFSDYSVVGGGRDNEIAASANYGVIAGGYNNDNAGSWAAAIGGGWENRVGTNSTSAVIGGGLRNQIRDNVQQATIAGGNTNVIWGGADFASIGGGRENVVGTNAQRASIGGGYQNRIGDGAQDATIAGGRGNVVEADALSPFMGGGSGNAIASYSSNAVVSGGLSNWIEQGSHSAAMAGGQDNRIRANSHSSFIGSGLRNEIGTNSPYAVICGGQSSTIGSNAWHSTIAGGYANRIEELSSSASIGGGQFNKIGLDSPYATVAGGYECRIADSCTRAVIGGGGSCSIYNNAMAATIAGGWENSIGASSRYATVSGGYDCDIRASSWGATISGGYECRIGNDSGYSTILGGRDCLVADDAKYACAAGYGARANHKGAFVWADSSGGTVSSTNADSWTVRCEGGARFFTGSGVGPGVSPGSGSWYAMSDKNVKENFRSVDGKDILSKLAQMDIAEWNYKTQDPTVRHLGPVAQDFRAAFGLGESDRSINSVDADGVALAAIQGLNSKVQDLEAENAELKARLERLEAMVGVR